MALVEPCTPAPATLEEAQASTSSSVLAIADFEGFRQIGKGKDSVVYAATCAKLGGKGVVLKVYDKTKISAVKHRSVRREARIMKYITQQGIPHCCDFIGAFQDEKQMYIVMELCGGGDLLEQLLGEGRAMTERRVAREVAAPVLTALARLHALGIMHRDIKLENLFINASGVILGDFGLALCVHEERAISPVGTLEYMPPEILRLPATDLVLSGAVRVEEVAPVDEKVDLWSFGVTVYELVTGRSPFEGGTKDDLRANILRHAMRPVPSFLSNECSDFIRGALAPDPKERLSAAQLLAHPWMVRYLPNGGVPRPLLGPATAAPAAAVAASAVPSQQQKHEQLLPNKNGEKQASSGSARSERIPAYPAPTSTTSGSSSSTQAAASTSSGSGGGASAVASAGAGATSSSGGSSGACAQPLPAAPTSPMSGSHLTSSQVGGSGSSGSVGSTASHALSVASVADSASSLHHGSPAASQKGHFAQEAIPESPTQEGSAHGSAVGAAAGAALATAAGATGGKGTGDGRRKKQSSSKKLSNWMCIFKAPGMGEESI